MNSDRVVSVTPDGDYNGTPKFKVVLESAGQYTFFGKFTAVAGDTIQYKVNNPKYKTAKLEGTSNPATPKQYDTAQSILRQVAFKGVIELIGAGVIELHQVEEYTNEFHNLLNR